MVFFLFLDDADAYGFMGVWEHKDDAVQAGRELKAKSKFDWSPDRYFVIEGELNKVLPDKQYRTIGFDKNEVK